MEVCTHAYSPCFLVVCGTPSHATGDLVLGAGLIVLACLMQVTGWLGSVDVALMQSFLRTGCVQLVCHVLPTPPTGKVPRSRDAWLQPADCKRLLQRLGDELGAGSVSGQRITLQLGPQLLVFEPREKDSSAAGAGDSIGARVSAAFSAPAAPKPQAGHTSSSQGAGIVPAASTHAMASLWRPLVQPVALVAGRSAALAVQVHHNAAVAELQPASGWRVHVMHRGVDVHVAPLHPPHYPGEAACSKQASSLGAAGDSAMGQPQPQVAEHDAGEATGSRAAALAAGQVQLGLELPAAALHGVGCAAVELRCEATLLGGWAPLLVVPPDMEAMAAELCAFSVRHGLAAEG